MEKNTEQAIDNVVVIKGVIERTWKDFSKASTLFICVGIVNLVAYLLNGIIYIPVESTDSITLMYFMADIFWILALVVYIILFSYFYKKIKATDNIISIGMLKIWGIVLIGSRFYILILSAVAYSGAVDGLNWQYRELILALPTIIALFMTGILMQKKAIVVASSLYGLVFLDLFIGIEEVTFEMVSGHYVWVSVSELSIIITMTVGMICLGMFLKRGVNKNSITGEAKEGLAQ